MTVYYKKVKEADFTAMAEPDVNNIDKMNDKSSDESFEEVKTEKVEEIEIKTEKSDVKTTETAALPPTKSSNAFSKLEPIVMPLLFTGLALFTRMHRIGDANRVVWDEAHFGKFGSYYLRHEFYHDVHPPLGKMLVGFSGYLAGYNGSWDFPSGQEYPDYLDYVKMRIFNAAFSAMCVPVAYYTAKALQYTTPSVWLFTCMVLFENSYCTLGRLILLDSILLFFTVTSMFSFIMYHNQREKPFSRKWFKWMFITGLNLGCVISVKMVGLFMITVVGIYTVVDLWNLLGDKKVTWKCYLAHWASRIVCLIIVPLLVFMLCFKIHFDLLTNSGTSDAVMPSLFQANLNGSQVNGGPRDVAIASSIITLKNKALGGGLLHSHHNLYPVGSQQQQVTTYVHSDENNDWYFLKLRNQTVVDYEDEDVDYEDYDYVEDGGIYRIVHKLSGRNLHSHPIPAPVTNIAQEVAGYGTPEEGDEFDYWVLEVVEQRGNENATRIHPLTTQFRLRHHSLGCYLSQTGQHLPEWGFRQGEVACMPRTSSRDGTTIWNIESHDNEYLPPIPEDFKYPQSGFLSDFIYLNMAMMATNNALVPDPEKNDHISSSWWEWPILYRGLRLGGWADDNVKYYLLGTPLTTWASTFAVVCFGCLLVALAIRWQRQIQDLQDSVQRNRFVIGGIYPLLGWALHYVPFAAMGRVTYLHHYLPALYFALLILTYFVETLTLKIKNQTVRLIIFGILIGGTVGCFALFFPVSSGMLGPASDYKYLNWFKTWKIHEDF